MAPFFSPQHITTHLPWQDRAVLLGPFHPNVVPTPWYCRHPRHRRRSSTARKGYPESIFRCSVPVPIKRVRGLLALLYSKIELILMAPTGNGGWCAGLPMFDEAKHPYDDKGLYYKVNLFDPLLEKKLGVGLSLEHDETVRPWLAVRNFARLRIQMLREQGYRNGGWWPAPHTFEIWVCKQNKLSLFQLAMRFEPNFMVNQRETVSWF
jgi:hypothetical protein